MNQLSTLRVWLLTVPFILLAPLSAGPVVVDFEGLPDSALVTNQIPGLVFTNTVILTSGISLNEFEFPPRSGVNVVSDNGGPITINFSSPVISVSGYFTYLTGLTLTAYDAGSNQVEQVLSAFTTNLALSGAPGSGANELLALTFDGGISSLTIAGDLAGGSFVLDDLAYTAAVPEPATFFISLIAMSLMTIRRRRLS